MVTHPAKSMDNMQNLMTTFLVLFVNLMCSLLSRADSDRLLRLDSLHFLLHQVRVDWNPTRVLQIMFPRCYLRLDFLTSMKRQISLYLFLVIFLICSLDSL